MKLISLIFLVLFLIVIGCPAPDYPVLFGYKDNWHKSLTFEEGPIKAKITGHIRLHSWGDALLIKVEINGLDTTKIVFFDTTNISGTNVKTTTYFDDKVIFESEAFWYFRYDIYKIKHRIDVVISATFENHKFLGDMTRDEFFAYLDMITARIRIEKIFAEPRLVDVKVDKDLLTRKLKKWVPALQDNN